MLRKLVRLLIRILQRADRFLNHVYAELHGYFWKPCPTCGEYFGGHELIFEDRVRPFELSDFGKPREMICPLCEAKLLVSLGKITPEMLRR